MQDLKIITFPVFAFSKCKYGAGILAVKILENKDLAVNWDFAQDQILLKSNYLRFNSIHTFLSYIISSATTINLNLKFTLSNSFQKDIDELCGYYMNYKVTMEEYELLFSIFTKLVQNGILIAKSKTKKLSTFNVDIKLDLSDISNLYPTKMLSITSKIDKFKETFKAFYYYNEFIFVEYEFRVDECENKLIISFKDATSMNIETSIK